MDRLTAPPWGAIPRNAVQFGGQLFGDGYPAEGPGQDPHQGDADLDGGEEPAGGVASSRAILAFASPSSARC